MIEFETTGGPEQLQWVERIVTAPRSNEVQVEVKATGLNRAELMYLSGQYLVAPPSPSKIGLEGSGIVTAVGSAVSQVKIGDDVSITPNLAPDEYGVLGQIVNVPVGALQPKPADLSFRDAAAFWMAYPTAWGGLVQAGGLRDDAGQTVVVSAASSSVGIAAIQIARAYGATVIATTRTQEKVDRIQAIGPDHIIVTDEEDLVARVAEITNGKGFDIAFDPVAGPFIEQLATCAGRDAMIVEYGLLSGEIPPLPFFAMIGKGVAIKTYHVVLDLLQQPQRFQKASDHLLPKLAEGIYHPVIDQVFTFDQARLAYERLASNQQFGKIVIDLTL